MTIEIADAQRETVASRDLMAYIHRARDEGTIVVIGPDGMTAAEIAARTWMWCLLGKGEGPEVVILARPSV